MEPVISLIDRPAALATHLRAWDELAVAAARPYCTPAWMLAWWRHAAPDRAQLRVLVLTQGSELVAIAPFYAERAAFGTRYRLLAAPAAARIEPLAVPGREEEAAHAFAGALADAEPRPAGVTFDQVPQGSPWPELLRGAWPARTPRVIGEGEIVAPIVRLDDRDIDTYMASRGAKFRGHLRRHRRQLERQGAQYRRAADGDAVSRGVADFARLHYGRWRDRGGSDALDTGVERMLEDSGRELLAGGRFRLFTIEVEGQTISAHLFLAAGGELAYWLGGFDPEWARYGPGNQVVLAAIEDALGRGDRRLDLGPGAQEYKLRFADGEDVLETLTLVTRPTRYPLALVLRATTDLRNAISARVPDSVKARLRRSPSE